MFCGCGRKKKKKKNGQNVDDDDVYNKKRPTPSPPKEAKYSTGLVGSKNGGGHTAVKKSKQSDGDRPPSLYHNDELGKSSVHNVNKNVDMALVNAAIKIAAEKKHLETTPYNLIDNEYDYISESSGQISEDLAENTKQVELWNTLLLLLLLL